MAKETARETNSLVPKGKNYDLDKTVLGMPHRFTPLSDPNNRVYAKTFIRSANIVNIIPGRPEFKEGRLRVQKNDLYKDLLEKDVAGDSNARIGLFKKDNYETFDRSYLTGDPKNSNNIHVASKSNLPAITERDLRFYSFKYDLTEYKRLLNIILNEVGAKMIGYSQDFNISSFINTIGQIDFNRGFHFYFDASSSFNESSSSDFGPSALEGMASGMGEMAKEMAFFAGLSERGLTAEAQKEIEKNVKSQGWGNWAIGGLAEGARGAGGMAESVLGSDMLAAIARGERFNYPKSWKGSSYDKNYNLNFHFISPYGDPYSVFEHVYLPFFMLFAMALPRQVDPMSYKSPMLIRMDCPGHFTCDMGAITNFSFTRGGLSTLWSNRGWPTAIEVNLTVTDMYPTMALATTQGLLRQNLGMMNFIDNAVGLHVMDLNIAANVNAFFTQKMSYVTAAPNQIETAGRQFVSNIGESVFGR